MTKRRAKALYADNASKKHDWKPGLTNCRRCGCAWTKWRYHLRDCVCWKMRLPKRKPGAEAPHP